MAELPDGTVVEVVDYEINDGVVTHISMWGTDECLVTITEDEQFTLVNYHTRFPREEVIEWTVGHAFEGFLTSLNTSTERVLK
jgi:hypothetical protein